MPAGLLHELALGFGRGGDRLFVGDARLAHLGLNRELGDQAADDDIEVEFAHAGDHGLAGLRVDVHLEGGVFLGQFLQGLTDAVLVRPRPGLDRHRYHRIWEVDRFQQQGTAHRAEGVPGKGIFQSQAGDDGAGIRLGDLFAVVGVHDQEAPDALAFAARRVVDLGAALDFTRIDPEVNQAAHEGIGDYFEGQRRERGLVTGGQ